MSRIVAWFYQFPTRRRALATGGFLLLSLCVVAASIAFFALSFGRPQMGILLSSDSGRWVVAGVDPNGAAFKDGIRVGDIPIAINGRPAQVFLDTYGQSGAVFGNTISRIAAAGSDGRIRTATVEDVSASAASVAEQIAFIVISVIFWITGFYVFFKKPRLLPAFLLALCSLVSGLALSANMAAMRELTVTLPIAVVAMTIGPWLLAHFFLILPEERAALRKDLRVYLIYVPAAITLALFPVLGYRNGQDLPGYRNFRMFEYAVAFAAAGAIAVFNYVRAASPRTRQQMRVVLISCLAALVPILVLNLPAQSIWGQPPIAPGFSFLFFAFIPIGLGYAVVSQKLMDIDVVIRRGVIYGLVSLVMAAILAVGILVVEIFRGSITTPQQVLMAVALGVVAATLFGPAKKGIEFAVDKLFYKDRYDYRQTIQSLNIALNSVKEFSDISRLITSTTANTLNLAGACLFVKGQRGLKVSTAQGTFTDSMIQLRLELWLRPIRRDHHNEFPNSASIIDPNLALLVPLVAGNQEVGVLCLSQKVSKQGFSSDDLYLIQGLASVGATALRSAILVHDVSVRDTFVSIASHELNTPLTAVVGNADLLLHSEELDAKAKRRVQKIFDGGQRISSIVHELLDLTRIQSGRVIMKLDKTKLDTILEENISMASESSARHQFSLDIAGDLPEVVVDRDKFGQVVWNLLSNAIKYSPKGGRIVLSARDDRQGHRVVVSVSDEGMGIGPADKASLFTTFHRIQRPETVSIKGAGLGLYIVKEWAEAMGGTVWLESELDKGSTFYVAVPSANSNGHKPSS